MRLSSRLRILPSLALLTATTLTASGCIDTVDDHDPSDPRRATASPLMIKAPGGGEEAFARLHADGSTSQLTLASGELAAQIEGSAGLPVLDLDFKSFGGQALETNTTQYPQRLAVRISETHLPPELDPDPDEDHYCSGIMIDARVVLTAAHCVHTGSQWREQLRITPAVDGDLVSFTAPFGAAEQTGAVVTQNYIDYGTDDVGLIFLNRPIGALTGWTGYSASTCDDLLNLDHATSSYPAEAPYYGDMYTANGWFSECPSAKGVTTFGLEVFGGQSGGGIYRMENGLPNTVATWVASNYTLDGEIWLSSSAHRIWPWWRDVITDMRMDSRSDTVDLFPLRVRTSTSFVQPELTGDLEGVSFAIINQGIVDYDDDVTADFYVVPTTWAGQAVESAGVFVGSHTFPLHADSGDAMVIEVPNGVVSIPESVQSIAGYGDAVDLVVKLNAAAGPDRTVLSGFYGDFDRDPVSLVDAQPDMSIQSLDAVVGTTKLGQAGPLAVDLEVENLGDVDTEGWSVNFYLSDQPNFGSGDGSGGDLIALGSGSAGDLAPGQSFADTFFLPIPEGVSGHYYLLAQLLTAGDSNPANNMLGTGYTIHLSGAPGGLVGAPHDLRIDYIGFPPGSYSASDSLATAFSVENVGGSPAVGYELEFYAVRDPLTMTPSVLLGYGSPPDLPAGDSFGQVVDLDLDQVPSGDWHLVVVAIAPGDADSSDNTRVSANTFEMELGLFGGGGHGGGVPIQVGGYLSK